MWAIQTSATLWSGARQKNFALRLLESVVQGLRIELEQDLFAKRGVICPALGLTGNSAADLAILNKDTDGPVPADSIKCLFEVKMSFIWNWKKKDPTHPVF